MNVNAKQKSVNWKQIGLIAVVVLVLGYSAARPTLQKWFNVELPSISDNDNNQNSGNGGNYNARLPENEAGGSAPAKAKNEDDFFASIKGDTKTSPAGLVYTMGPRREHRVEHVMNHAKDVPSKPVHGVFIGSRLEILEMIDEAYELVKAKSSQVKTSSSRGKMEHLVDMKRNTGYEGGAKGKRSNNRKLGKVKLVLDGKKVITAFPTR